MSPQRRDSEGPWQSAHSWESLVDGTRQRANACILRLNSEAPTLRQHRSELDMADLLARLEPAFADGC